MVRLVPPPALPEEVEIPEIVGNVEATSLYYEKNVGGTAQSPLRKLKTHHTADWLAIRRYYAILE